ncbi:hypothetical protein IQ247_24450 [Plectonema cf. radiosum LEGE 06105]|uniref:Uncharacterized protein n=1 Tax=Plectonema cf. radiosum LEGE 06105 TaxID=945769 RepID=A0A8J7F6V9_9CYAN|nr:hypothetical protein [Plectonema radiosum]MBE9215778.1 hypothetical protein [Plectonema cf. radiosum LEGE 06105]
MNLSPSDWLENIISQLPALTLLQNMGYEYLTPQSALAKRMLGLSLGSVALRIPGG